MSRLYLFLAQSTNLDLGRFRFRQEVGGMANELVAFVIGGLVLVAVGVAIAVYLRRRARLAALNREMEEARLRLLVTELNVGETEQRLLAEVAGSEAPHDLIPLLESRDAFEQAVAAYRTGDAPDAAALRRIPALRQRLEYGFGNNRNPFVDTRMLAPGTRLRCRIQLPQREVEFVTSVLAVSETQLVVRPPTSRGRAVSLGRVRELTFRVSRENDAEYEFTTRVLGQTNDAMKAVRVAHTHHIDRMLFRNAERIDVAVETQFYVIRHELAGERMAFRAEDSQFTFTGVIRDLSMGGALVTAPRPQRPVHDGDAVVFRLPDAQIRDDISAMVVGVFEREEGQLQLHLQFAGLRELNRLKLNRYLQNLREAPPPQSGAGESPAPAAP